MTRLGDERYLHYVHSVDGFTSVYIYQNTLCILYIFNVYCIVLSQDFFFLVAFIKYSDTTRVFYLNLHDKGFILTLNSSSPVHCGRGSLVQALEAAGHSAPSQEAGERWIYICAQHAVFFSCSPAFHLREWCHPQKRALYSSVNLVNMVSHLHAPSLGSQVTLYLSNQKNEREHHNLEYQMKPFKLIVFIYFVIIFLDLDHLCTQILIFVNNIPGK